MCLPRIVRCYVTGGGSLLQYGHASPCAAESWGGVRQDRRRHHEVGHTVFVFTAAPFRSSSVRLAECAFHSTCVCARVLFSVCECVCMLDKLEV